MSMPRCAFLLCATLCILSLATVASAKPSDTSSDPLAQYVAQGYDYVPDQLLVKFKPGTRASEKAAIHRKMRGKKLRESSYRAFTVVKLQKGTNVHAAAKAYGRYKKVIYAEPNYIRWASFVPNDTEYPNQWHLYNAVNKGLNVEAAWDITMGDPSVKVAVIDTGVAYENYDEDGDGFYDYLVAPDLAGTDFWRGRDFVNGDKHANDDEGHGTHVTGTIAQTTNNALGCAGVAPNVTIIPVKVLSEWGWGTTEWIVNGIYYAAYVGADVINMSLGGSCPSSSEQAACWFAYKRGVTIVAAAGNDGWEYLGFPAGYDESVIAVGATDYENNLAPYSSYGYGLDFDDQGLDVVAPGGDTSADLNLDGNPDGVLQQTLNYDWVLFQADPLNFVYEYWNGTSMASPHVAGVAALLVSLGVDDPDEIRAILEGTATDLGDPGYDIYTGWGLVDAEAAVLAVAAPPAPPAPAPYDAGPTAEAGPNQTLTDSDSNGYESVTLDGSASTYSEGFPITFYRWEENGILLAEGATPTVNLAVGTHVIALTCVSSSGLSDKDTVTITINPGPPAVRVLGIDVIGVPYKYGYRIVTATVTVVDSQNRPVSSARIIGQWSGDLVRTPRPEYTNAQGQVTFKAGGLPPGSYTFSVSSVYKSGYIYRSDLNGETSDTLTFY